MSQKLKGQAFVIAAIAPQSLVGGLARFPEGKFKYGDRVRLAEPAGHENVFDEPTGVMTIVATNWFRTYELPIYTLQQDGGVGVTPFRDEDLLIA